MDTEARERDTSSSKSGNKQDCIVCVRQEKIKLQKDSCAKQKSNFFEGYIKRLVCLSFITKFEKSQNWYSLKYKKIDGFLLA